MIRTIEVKELYNKSVNDYNFGGVQDSTNTLRRVLNAERVRATIATQVLERAFLETAEDKPLGTVAEESEGHGRNREGS